MARMNEPLLDRRSLLGLLAGSALAACTKTVMTPIRTPAIFLAHGFPMLLDVFPEWAGELRAWAANLGRPKAILMISAHWEEMPIALGALRTVPLYYDFGGFPEKYYKVKYPAPGAPDLAARVKSLLAPHAVQQTERGLDHGAYVPLLAMYPEADVPVLQLSLPTMDPKLLFELGRSLAPLRDEGVLIIGSGFLTHNLRAFDMRGAQAPTPDWAAQFDAYVASAILAKDADAILDYRAKAPGVRMALPSHEHFVPAIVSMGAAIGDAVKFPIEGFVFGAGTKRSIQWG